MTSKKIKIEKGEPKIVEPEASESNVPGVPPLIENLWNSKTANERCVKIYLLSIQGVGPHTIAKMLNCNPATVWRHLQRIKKAGAVLQNQDIEDMKKTFTARIELLIGKAFADLNDPGTTVAERHRIRGEIRQHLDTLASAFWKTSKFEPVPEESPLSVFRDEIRKLRKKHES